MKTPEWAKDAGNKVISELYGRSGFDHWYDDIRDEDQREIDDTLARLIAEAHAKADGWRPIAEAPKDGNILLSFPYWGAIRGRWNTDQYATKPRPYFSHDCERSFGTRETRNNQPTHWRPLPAPPAIGEEGM